MRSAYFRELLHQGWRISTYGTANGRPTFPKNPSPKNTRCESLAHYGLSRFSLVYPFPDDSEVIDFTCALMGESEFENWISVYPEDHFYVKVVPKENHYQNLDGLSTHYVLNHMRLPLFFCVVDKEGVRGGELEIYSTSYLWSVLTPRQKTTALRCYFTGGLKVIEHQTTVDCELGPPVLKMTMEEIESNPKVVKEILYPWIQIDKTNLTYRTHGTVKWYPEGVTNQPVTEPPKIETLG